VAVRGFANISLQGVGVEKCQREQNSVVFFTDFLFCSKYSLHFLPVLVLQQKQFVCPKKASQVILSLHKPISSCSILMDTQNECFSFPFTKIRGRRRSNTPSWIFAGHMIANI
jgi:hypothetical protein